MRLRPARLVAPAVALLLLAGACADDPPDVIVSGVDPTNAPMDIVETLEAQGFTILASLIEEAGLAETLSAAEDDQSFTLFAPTDDAFAELTPGLVDVLVGEEEVLVMPDDRVGEGFTGDVEDPDVEGETPDDGDETDTDTDDGGTGDGETENGDGETAGEGTTTTSLAERPSPDEISGLLRDILLHHVVEGRLLSTELADEGEVTSMEGTVLEIGTREEEPAVEGGDPTVVTTVDLVPVSEEDLLATNGVIHAIDEVLIPEDRADAVDQLAASIPVASDVVSTLRATGEHDQLVASLESTGLADPLSSAEAVTVFAPTDAAFGDLTVHQSDLLADPAFLELVLEFHVVERELTVDDVVAEEAARTRHGETLTVVNEDGALAVEETEVEYSTPATNGVVHSIDDFLVPDEATGPGGF